MDEYEEHERLIRRLERERVALPPKPPRQPRFDDSPEATAARRAALEKAIVEHEQDRPLRAVSE